MPAARQVKQHKNFLQAVGQRLRAIRTFRGLTQPEVGAVVHARLGRTAYAKYETGTREMRHETAGRLCRGFGITLDLLTFGDIGADMWASDPALCAHLLLHYSMEFRDIRPPPTAPLDTTPDGAANGPACPSPGETPTREN
jgi:transcriptional regulator with XRE-family HTH domain